MQGAHAPHALRLVFGRHAPYSDNLRHLSVEKISLGLLLSPNSRSSESPEAWHRKRNETLAET